MIAPAYQLRAPQRADLDSLQKLEQSAFTTDRLSRRQMQHWMQSSRCTFTVCEDRGTQQAVGYALVFYRGDSDAARLYSIVIDARCRGHGLARHLLAHSEQEAKQRGCRRMRLEVSPANTAALGLYEAMGYSRFGMYSAFYEDGGDALRLEKAL